MPRIGRPRSEKAHRAILQAALDLAFEAGFHTVTAEAIAARAGVGKTTLYRRWPNKAAVVMDAFLADVGPGIGFPPHASALERVRLQMRAVARTFRGRHGALIKALLGEAQQNPELAEAFRERWIAPRRAEATAVLREARTRGELRPGTNIDAVIDALYGAIYYRLQIGTGPLSDAAVDLTFRTVADGIRA
jgi:AcrR family transcriptional regulator